MNIFVKGFFTIYLVLGLIWLRSSVGKITSGTFPDTLAGTLTKLAPNNPYPWFKNFLLNVAMPNAKLFGNLTMYGEVLTAIAITFASAYLIFFKADSKLAFVVLLVGLLGGLFLNIIFWLGFGYSSPSTDSLNILMLVIELIGAIVIINTLLK